MQGMVLDLEEAALTVFVNGEYRGVMAGPGMTDDEGDPLAALPRLGGSLRWAAAVGEGASVEIEGPLEINGPLPLPITTLGAARRRLALASMRNRTLLPIG